MTEGGFLVFMGILLLLVVIVVVMCVLSILRLKQGAVKAEDLAAKKEEIVRQAITDTTADEAEAA